MSSAAALRAQADLLEAQEKSQSIHCEQLLDDISRFIRRFVLLTEEQAAIMALWTMHTYCWTVADQTPYISVVSPEPRCGKSRFVEVEELLVNEPLVGSRMTAASVPRAIKQFHPTLFLDEADVTFANKEASDTIRQVLNSGHRAGNPSIVCAPGKKGGDWNIEKMDTFCPKFVCSIDSLPGTLEDRSIVINVTRKIESDGIERFYRRDHEEYTKQLKEKMQAWATANMPKLKDMRPELPKELSDRRQEAVEQLVAIAELAGGKWPELSRWSMVQVCSEGYGATNDSVQLLTDICNIFVETQNTFISSELLYSKLLQLEPGLWTELKLTKTGIARMLKKHRIEPVQKRQANGHLDKKPVRGYELKSFLEAFKRFVPLNISINSSEKVQTVQPALTQDESEFSEKTRTAKVSVQTPARDLTCHYEVPEKVVRNSYMRYDA